MFFKCKLAYAGEELKTKIIDAETEHEAGEKFKDSLANIVFNSHFPKYEIQIERM